MSSYRIKLLAKQKKFLTKLSRGFSNRHYISFKNLKNNRFEKDYEIEKVEIVKGINSTMFRVFWIMRYSHINNNLVPQIGSKLIKLELLDYDQIRLYQYNPMKSKTGLFVKI